MNDRDSRRYTMFERVQTFGQENAADFLPDSPGGARFAAITQILHDIDSAKAVQQLGGATAKEAVIETLRESLRKVVRTARAVAQDDAGFADNFHMPRQGSQAALLTAVDATLLQLGTPGVVAPFVTHGLPADFVQHLAADRLAAANARGEVKGTDHGGVISTAAIDRLMRAGMKEVKYLDAIVHNAYAPPADQLRAWEIARTVERAARRKKKPGESPTAAATPSAPAVNTVSAGGGTVNTQGVPPTGV